MAWRLEITDADYLTADPATLERLDALAEEYCHGGLGTIVCHDMPWAHKRVLMGPGELPAFLLSDHMLNPTQE